MTPIQSPSASPVPVAQIGELRADVHRSPIGAASAADVDKVVAADTRFGFALYQQLANSQHANLFISPHSIASALSMTYSGARGETANQLAAALGIEGDADTWNTARSSLDLRMMVSRPTNATEVKCPKSNPTCELDAIKLEITNAMFGQAGFEFEDDFLKTLAAYYGAGMQTVDFVSDPEAARRAINEFVAEKTHGRIPELINQLDPAAVAVLVNAIYFHANWHSLFDPTNTHDDNFATAAGSVNVTTMHNMIDTSYADGGDWQAVSLPYIGGASMIAIVPAPGHFDSVQKRLGDIYRRLDSAMEEHLVTLAMPKWQSESDLSLGDTLAAMGITDMFSNAADFSGIDGTHDLVVSDVIHQANVSVDENGTEAAAATAVTLSIVCLCPPPPATLTIDRPFIYLIRDDQTREILFLGRILDPTAG